MKPGFVKRAVRIVGLLGFVAVCLIRNPSVDDLENISQLVREPSGVQTRNDAQLLSGWLDQVENSWEVGKNHDHVKSAFESVISQARISTVRIFQGDRQIAMGTIVDRDGIILTKASEVEGKSLICQFHDGSKRRAKVMEADRNTDLALLRVRASNLVPVKWDASGELSLGSILATPGHGTKPLAIGVLSLNTHQVESDGVLGIMMARTDRGPRVTEVVDGSAAEKAGVEIGDQIVAMNSRPVDSLDMVISSVSQMLPGEVVRLKVIRDEQERELVATLGRRSDLDVDNGDFQSYLGGRLSFRRSGFGSVLQHDTFLLPEYCGGPIVDLQGNVVGVNIARAERIASYALPATVVKAWIDQAMQKVQTSVVASK